MAIKSFGELGREDASIAGGKGASLGEMTRAGIPVPPGFVVLSESFEQFLRETDLGVEIDTILHTVDTQAMHTVEHASERIQKLILEATMPDDIKSDIVSHFHTLGAQYVAVRSSATAEDSASAAWAGQLDSFLNTTEATLLENVQRCWASLFTPRAIFYRFEQGLHATKISVAVVVQKMVESEVSGIAFSVHPVTEDRNQLIIEAGYGLGEAIVSGQITPDSYVVEKSPRRIIDKNIVKQDRGIYRRDPSTGSGSANEWRGISDEEGNPSTGSGQASMQKLTDEQILELAEIIVIIENHYGFPCDIEWALEACPNVEGGRDGKFYIVQSRPITTLDQQVQETSAIDPLSDVTAWRLWGKWKNSVLASGFYYGFTSREIFQKLRLPTDFRGWGVNIGGYVYALEDDHQIFNTHIIDAFKQNHSWFNDFFALEEQLEFRARDVYRKGDILASMELLSDIGCLSMIIHFCDKGLEGAVPDLALSNGITSDEFSKLLVPYKPTLTMQYKMALRQVRVGSLSLESLLQDFQWVGSGYLDEGKRLTVMDVQEEIDSLSDDEPISEENSQPLDLMLQAQVAILQKLIYFRSVNAELITKVLNGLWESLDELSARHGLKRRDLGVFTPEEIMTLVRTDILPTDTQLRLEKNGVEENGISDVNGEVRLFFGQDLKRALMVFEPMILSDQASLSGTVAFKGKARGRVKIVESIHDLEKIQTGDIMVAPETVPDYIVGMKKAAAFVTNQGGITSHAAIVARELRKPCLIGTKTATKVFHDDDLVEVDADNGVVRILEKSLDKKTKQEYFVSRSRKGQSPFPANWNGKSETDPHARQIHGAGVHMVGQYYGSDGYYNGFYHLDEWNEVCQSISERIVQDDQYVARQYHAQQEQAVRASDFVQSLSKENLDALEIDQLLEWYTKIEDAWIAFDQDNIAPWYFGADGALQACKTLLLDVDEQSQHILFTNPVSSFSQYEELTLFEIAKAVSIKKIDEEVLSPSIWRQIDRLVERYYWIPFGYNGPEVYDREHYHAALREILKEHTSASIIEKIETLKNYESSVREAQKNIVEQYHVSKEAEELLERMYLLTCMTDERKEVTCPLHVAFDRVLQALSLKTGITKELLNYVSVDEIRQGLHGSLDIVSLGLMRKTEGVLFLWQDGVAKVLVGVEAREYAKIVMPDLSNQSLQSIIGEVGSRGKKTLIQARVRVLLTSHNLEVLQPGEVLVAPMTTPEYVPAMRKSSAIITDEGGVTCHAAIVARELGIPCIIGTKIATQVLKDGDLVEVDANTGVVRILERAEEKGIDFKNRKWAVYGASGWPAYITPFGVVSSRKFSPVYGLATEGIGLWKGSNFDWLFDEAELNAFAVRLLPKLLHQPWGQYDTWQIQAKKFDCLHEELWDVNLSECTDKELKDWAKKYYEAFMTQYVANNFIEPLSFYFQHHLRDLLVHEGIGDSQVKMLIERYGRPSKSNYIKQCLEEYKKVEHKDDLVALLKKFHYLKNDYTGSYQMTKHDLETLEVQESHDINTVHDKALPKEVKDLLAVLQMTATIQDTRKAQSLMWISGAEKIIREVAKRVDIPLEELLFATWEEIIARTFDRAELKRRREGCVIYWQTDKTDIYSGTQAIQMMKDFKKILIGDDVERKGVRGVSASGGVMTGRVVVVSDVRQFDKVKEGDVLVTMMTRPEYLPVMRLAGAFVTDEGGITSHAAIVAREMKKPCIIGTKIATQVLKDGDLVEVDAEQGIVRILERGPETS